MASFLRLLDHTQRRATAGRTPLDERSARRKKPLPYCTQYSQQTNFHARCGIRTRNLSMRATADPHLRLRGQWDLLLQAVPFQNEVPTLTNTACPRQRAVG